ncbi:heavy metal translocating P-type ATPase [Malacoplasma iowae]|uniref:heavy metal translocating P-type ATPase n=1 Tax=Malacoplasma iowae TaxID=2116 RepID=UPI002A18CF66|nr:cation-translocating P-type ATPase [Malacoplasma iowae]WPL38369.1 cation-translocating P-type ATPase [Malacoplasma iowae]WPL41086.1 cation-translocating P-type ATPase [Malacoplasma iowae]
MTYFNKLKKFRTLESDVKKEFISDTFLYLSLLMVLPLMVVHLYFIFGHEPMPFWFEWFSFLLCTFAFFTCGYAFFKYFYYEVFKWHSIGMNTLITIASVVAYVYSCYQIIANTISFANNTATNHTYDFSHTAAMIVVIVKVGENISNHLRKKTTNDLKRISELQVQDCYLYDMKTKEEKLASVKDVKIGDYILVKKGSNIPIDGIIVEGDTDIDESMITGESKPIKKSVNEYVIGSTNNLTSSIIIKATAVGKNMIVNQIVKNVNSIASKKPKYQKIADRVSKWFTIVIILLAILAFLLHLLVDNINEINGVFNNWFNITDNATYTKVYLAFFYSVGTLAIACPCALGIAVPVASLVGASKAAKNGIIINTGETYEKIKKIDAIAFDKTGTLTSGKFLVENIYGDKNNISMIYYMEKTSIHPLAISFVEYVKNNEINIKDNDIKLSNLNEIAGVGIKANFQNKTYLLSSYDYAIKNNFKLSSDLKSFSEKELNDINDNILKTIVCLSVDNKIVNIIVFSDQISENAYDAINLLHSKGIETYIISGDNYKAVETVSKELNIKNFYANTKPSDKASIIKEIQSKNKVVAYIGDGINDLEALKQSDLSIAISKENKIAQSISDITIINHDILNIIKAIEITKETRRMIIFNLIWAFSYNIVTLPLSIIGFIPPFIGVFIMATSDVTVVLNSLYFKLKKIRYISKKEQKTLKNKNIDCYVKN